MDLEKYEYSTDNTFASFEFYSQGPNGQIRKVVNYTHIDTWPNGAMVFNLGFGDWDEHHQRINDLTVSNNKDRDKILATVAGTVLDFTNCYGTFPIVAKGSTAARTRLYQMGIAANLEVVEAHFSIFGLTPNGWEKFEKGRNFEAFLVIRK